MANTDQIQANWFVHTNRCSEDVQPGKISSRKFTWKITPWRGKCDVSNYMCKLIEDLIISLQYGRIHTNNHITDKIELISIQVDCTNFVRKEAFNKIVRLNEVDHLQKYKVIRFIII